MAISRFSAPYLKVFFQSDRAKIDGKAVHELVKFIQGAKQSLDVAIYDLRNETVLKALKSMSTKVRLHILYDSGRPGGASKSVDPKPSKTAEAIKAHGLDAFAQPVNEKSSHLMHDKFIVRDGSSVWTGSGNFTNGGLLLQDNNFITIDSPGVAAAYAKTFGDLGAPGHSSTHVSGAVTSSPTKVKVGAIPITIEFSTQVGETEGVETEVQQRLASAKKVRIIAMLISDPGILTSLLPFRNANKDILGVLDPHETKVGMGKKAGHPEFWFAQGDPRFTFAPSKPFDTSGNDTNNFMHNKLMIIDDKIVITGSYNFSENAEANDENMLVIESAAVAAAYDKCFNALFTLYQKTGPKLP
jgi:phosphatidylserine/phosphatidylglycerophosphate/cardiolipin synthase-like enzyme